MLNRNLVTSGFDTETVVSEDYLTYLLLAQIEAGRLPMEVSIVDPAEGIDVALTLHPPSDYERLYEPDPEAPLPEAVDGSFQIRLLEDEGSPVATLAFQPDGTRIASGSWDGVVRVWDVESRVDETIFRGHGSSVSGVAFSPDGSRLVSCSVDGTARVLDPATGDELIRFNGHSGPLFGVAFHPDGQSVASCGSDRTIRIWDAASGTELSALSGHDGPIFSLAFNPDGTRLVSGSLDGTARVWDLVGTADPTLLIEGDRPVNSVAFSPDGSQIAAGTADHSTHLFDAQSNALLRRFAGHEGSVSSIAFSPDGTRLVSGSQDGTARLWNVETGAEILGFTGQTKPVLSVAFHPDGGSIASGSENTNFRRWSAVDGEELGAFRVAFVQLLLFVTIVDNVTGVEFPEFSAMLEIDFELDSNLRDNGLENNHNLRLSLVRLHPDTANLLAAAQVNVEAVERELRAQLDRAIPLGVAQGQQVLQLRMRKFADTAVRSLGLYVNLALRSGPEPDAFLEPRGSLGLAQDFRDPISPLAFATAPGLFPLLGPDAKFRQAEETEEGSGSFKFPLREDFDDPDSDEIGNLKGVKVLPEILRPPNQPPIPTGRLLTDVHGEYTDALGDPDFHLELYLKPKIEEGLVDWDLDADVRFGVLATLLLVATGIVLTIFFAPALAWGSTLLVGSLVGLAVLKELIAEPLAAKLVQDRLDEESQASFLDALPFRVPATNRRWDPFYVTQHEVVVLVDEVTIDSLGIAFEGTATRLGKRPQPVNHVVIRDEERSDVAQGAEVGEVTALRYRVSDFPNITADLEAVGPGRDRMDFSHLDLDGEPTLLSLTKLQIAERLETGRLFSPILLNPERIHLVNNQIDSLLCLSTRERRELRDGVIRAFRARTRAQIIEDDGDTLRQELVEELEIKLGRAPTDDEVDKALDEKLKALVDELLPAFEEDSLEDDLEAAIAGALRFDLAPEELIELQTAGALFLDGKAGGERASGAPEIIIRNNADGTTTPYYRDRPDEDPEDNLLSLPRYSAPYVPPE